MDGSPVWLLDIDGVLNAISAEPHPSVWPEDSWIRAEARCAGVDWPLLAARPVLDFIRSVHEAGRAEIRWHTTWQHEAAGVARALDLPDFPVQPCPEFTSYLDQRVGGVAPTGAQWWKLPAADRVVGVEERALVWTDDDIDQQLIPYGRHHPILRIPAVLTVCPRTQVGLGPYDLRVIDAFLRAAVGPPEGQRSAADQEAGGCPDDAGRAGPAREGRTGHGKLADRRDAAETGAAA